MRKKKVSEKYIRLVLDMYKDAETVVRSTAGTSSLFPVKVGLHQGSALSPFSFQHHHGCPNRGSKERVALADDVCG